MKEDSDLQLTTSKRWCKHLMVGLNFIYAQRKSYERNNFMKVFRQVKFDSIGGGRPNIECHVEKRIYF